MLEWIYFTCGILTGLLISFFIMFGGFNYAILFPILMLVFGISLLLLMVGLFRGFK